eukprot:6507741-Ditylum_brightwellii.AAC.1
MTAFSPHLHTNQTCFGASDVLLSDIPTGFVAIQASGKSEKKNKQDMSPSTDLTARRAKRTALNMIEMNKMGEEKEIQDDEDSVLIRKDVDYFRSMSGFQ